MQPNITQQDFMSATVDARNKIIERLVTKYDVQAAADAARDRILNDLNAMHLESQALTRQTNAQSDRLWRKMATLESQLVDLQQDMRKLTTAVNRLCELQTGRATTVRAAE